MPGFRLSGKALRDVAEIIGYEHKHAGSKVADRLEDGLLNLFGNIAESPEMGHRRSDLTSRNILLHYARPYFIVFRRTRQSVQILRVVHESRDLRKFL